MSVLLLISSYLILSLSSSEAASRWSWGKFASLEGLYDTQNKSSELCSKGQCVEVSNCPGYAKISESSSDCSNRNGGPWVCCTGINDVEYAETTKLKPTTQPPRVSMSSTYPKYLVTSYSSHTPSTPKESTNKSSSNLLTFKASVDNLTISFAPLPQSGLIKPVNSSLVEAVSKQTVNVSLIEVPYSGGKLSYVRESSKKEDSTTFVTEPRLNFQMEKDWLDIPVNNKTDDQNSNFLRRRYKDRKATIRSRGKPTRTGRNPHLNPTSRNRSTNPGEDISVSSSTKAPRNRHFTPGLVTKPTEIWLGRTWVKETKQPSYTPSDFRNSNSWDDQFSNPKRKFTDGGLNEYHTSSERKPWSQGSRKSTANIRNIYTPTVNKSTKRIKYTMTPQYRPNPTKKPSWEGYNSTPKRTETRSYSTTKRPKGRRTSRNSVYPSSTRTTPTSRINRTTQTAYFRPFTSSTAATKMMTKTISLNPNRNGSHVRSTKRTSLSTRTSTRKSWPASGENIRTTKVTNDPKRASKTTPSYRRTSTRKYSSTASLPDINIHMCGVRDTNAVANRRGRRGTVEINREAKVVNSDSGVDNRRSPSFERIVGGKEAEPFSWPWVAAIYKVNPRGGNRFLSAGSLINENFVLTAAHSFTQDDIRSASFVVMLGTHTAKEAVAEYSVMFVLRHPNYQQRFYYHDIALLRLIRPVQFNDYVMPVCLPSPAMPLIEDSDLVGKRVTVMGWGDDSYGGITSRVLKEATFPIVSRYSCNASYINVASNRFPKGITNNMLCAGAPNGGKDACQGDSGGPLTTIENGRYTQVGIVSFGYRCGDKEYPGVYTKVAAYLSWIAENARCEDTHDKDYDYHYGR